MCATSAANLLLKIPACISEEDKGAIITDFENGRVLILLQLALKMSHWQAYPWKVYGAACCDVMQSPEILGAALASTCSHPQVEMLREESMQDALQSFMDNPGALFQSPDPQYLKCLRRWFAAVRTISVVERRVEGKHATSKKGVTRAPHHSCPYVSLLHRIGEIKAFLQGPHGLKDLAREVQRVRSGLTAVKLLNLDMHPECEKATHYRDAVYARVIYHADAYVKYCMAQPSVPVHKPGEGELASSLPMNDCQEAMRLELGRRHAKARFQQLRKGSTDSDSPDRLQDCFLSFPMSEGALKTLKSFLIPANQSGIVPEEQLANAPFDVCGDFGLAGSSHAPMAIASGPAPAVPEALQRLIFCKLVSQVDVARGRREKVAGELSLTNSFAVTTHTVLNVNAERKEILLSTAPMNLASVSADNVPLMLNPFNLSLSQLENVRVWKRSQEVVPFTFTFRFQYLHTLASLDPDLLKVAPGFLKKLMDRPAGIHLGKLSGSLRQLVQLLQKDDVIVPDEHTLETDSCLWRLSDKGAEMVEACVVVTGGSKLLCKAEPPATPLTMTTYEVVLELEAAGFKHVVVDGKVAKMKKKKPYTQGDSKEWLTKENQAKVSHFYLCALLLAGKHGKAVPHFDADRKYKEILGLSDEACKGQRSRKVRLSIQTEEFLEMESEHLLALADESKQKKSRPKKRRQTFGKDVDDNDEGDAASAHGADLGQMSSSESEAESVELPSPSLAPSCSCRTASSEPRSGSSSSSSSDTSGSSSSSDSESASSSKTSSNRGAKVRESSGPERTSATTEEPVPDQHNAIPYGRGRFRNESWGAFKLIYFDRKGSTGFQLTCTNPKHNADNQALCTKSRSNRFEGGTETCLRMLKQWAILGKDVSSKDAHQQLWKTVQEAAEHGTLWTAEKLEVSKIVSWTEASSSSSQAPAPGRPGPAGAKRKR